MSGKRPKHIDMSEVSTWVAFGRVCLYAVKEFWRNFGLSAITITVLVLALLSVNVLLTINVVTRAAVRAVEDQIDVSVFFAPDAPAARVAEVVSFVQSFPEVKDSIFKTADEVLAEFQAKHTEDADVVGAIGELADNPFGAVLVFKTFSAWQYQKIFAALSVPEYDSVIEEKTFDSHARVIERLQTITERVQRFGVGVAALFIIIAFLIIFNTIRVGIYTQREEIQIKKLVGATNWFVRGPFLLVGLFYTVAAMVVVMVLVALAVPVIDSYLGTLITEQGFSVQKYFMGAGWKIFGGELVALLALTSLSAAVAMRRYLRV